MSNEACIATFAAAPESHERVEFIDKNCPDLICEVCQVAEHNPHPIDANETLVRLLMDPTHVHLEGGEIRLKSSAFSDAESFGSSVLRREQAESSEYHETVAALLANPKAHDGSVKKLYGVVLIPVSTVRSVQHKLELEDKTVKNERALATYATALPTRPSHADIMVNMRSQITKSKANRATINLTKAAGLILIQAVDFKDADLSAWCPPVEV